MGHGETDRVDFRKGLERALARIEALKAELAQRQRSSTEPIAVIGMGCRFPNVSSPGEFWQFIMNGGDAVREMPETRPELFRMGQLFPSTRWAGVFDAVDKFDARF